MWYRTLALRHWDLRPRCLVGRLAVVSCGRWGIVAMWTRRWSGRRRFPLQAWRIVEDVGKRGSTCVSSGSRGTPVLALPDPRGRRGISSILVLLSVRSRSMRERSCHLRGQERGFAWQVCRAASMRFAWQAWGTVQVGVSAALAFFL